MKNEYDSLVENNVWSFVKSDEKPVGSRWHFAFALKFGPEGDICRYKARFVAKGFSQVFGEDFYETPTTRLSTIRIFMLLAKVHSWIDNFIDVMRCHRKSSSLSISKWCNVELFFEKLDQDLV